MELSRKEEYRNQKVSIGVTVFSFVVMLGFFIFTNFVNASSSPLKTGMSDVTLSFENGNDEKFSVNKEAALIASKQEDSSEKLVSSVNSEMPLTDSKTIIEKYKTITPGTTDPNTMVAEAKEPVGPEGKDPASPSVGGTEAGIGFNLTERKMIMAPHFISTTKEEGKVVVEIVVDANGDVIEADANGRGSTTNSVYLKNEAVKMALATKFNKNQKLAEQRGTITLIFSYN